MKQGIKYDAIKPMWNLLDFNVLAQVVDVLTYGAQKYAPDNWKKVPNAKERYFAAVLRHIKAWRCGEELDAESGLPHLAHAVTSLMFIIALPKAKEDTGTPILESLLDKYMLFFGGLKDVVIALPPVKTVELQQQDVYGRSI